MMSEVLSCYLCLVLTFASWTLQNEVCGRRCGENCYESTHNDVMNESDLDGNPYLGVSYESSC
jgi:hypothetical protein